MHKIGITLEGDTAARLDHLAARLQLAREEAAARLLAAAVDALECEERFEWPIHLVQADWMPAQKRGRSRAMRHPQAKRGAQ